MFLYIDPLKQGLKPLSGILTSEHEMCFYT